MMNSKVIFVTLLLFGVSISRQLNDENNISKRNLGMLRMGKREIRPHSANAAKERQDELMENEFLDNFQNYLELINMNNDQDKQPSLHSMDKRQMLRMGRAMGMLRMGRSHSDNQFQEEDKRQMLRMGKRQMLRMG